jgi:hypothetical protein
LRACGGAAAQFEQLAVRGGERGFEGGDLVAAAAPTRHAIVETSGSGTASVQDSTASSTAA